LEKFQVLEKFRVAGFEFRVKKKKDKDEESRRCTQMDADKNFEF
jgi:hypothetical protein